MTLFDRSRLTIRSAIDRRSRVSLKDAKKGIEGVPPLYGEDKEENALTSVRCEHQLRRVVHWLKTRTGPAVWFFGGHVFKANVEWYINQLGPWINHLATNGAGLVHAVEMNYLGHTSEHVVETIKDGSFGMWAEVSQINRWVDNRPELGVSEACGGSKTCKSSSVHVAIGQDIFCMHPNYDAQRWGEAAYVDFLKFASVVEHMQGGTFLVFGSAVCAPEVFLKALSMARNVNNGKPDDIAIAVFDCVPLPDNKEARYLHRPAKTLLDRCASESVFVQGRHEVTIPNLWRLLCAQ